jgi:hypothetical protein
MGLRFYLTRARVLPDPCGGAHAWVRGLSDKGEYTKLSCLRGVPRHKKKEKKKKEQSFLLFGFSIIPRNNYFSLIPPERA